MNNDEFAILSQRENLGMIQKCLKCGEIHIHFISFLIDVYQFVYNI